jgi:hypothetical protein
LVTLRPWPISVKEWAGIGQRDNEDVLGGGRNTNYLTQAGFNIGAFFGRQ